MASPLTPNQAARREALVVAAAEVMRRNGVAACTARAIEKAGPLTKSAVHYYFTDIDELVDEAFEWLIERGITRIEAAADQAPGPVGALWAAAGAYLSLGTDRAVGRPSRRADRVPLLWLEYRAASVRRGRTATSSRLERRLSEVFARLVGATGVDDAANRADLLYTGLVGAAVRACSAPLDHDVVLARLARACGLPQPPAPTGR